MVKRTTTIRISEELWRYLISEKRLGETYDDVLRRLLNLNRIRKKEGGEIENV